MPRVTAAPSQRLDVCRNRRREVWEFMGLTWFIVWKPLIIVLGAFARPERRGAPKRNGGQGRFPFRELAKEALEGFASLWREIFRFSEIRCWFEQLSWAMGEADQFIGATSDGGLPLKSPEECAFGRSGFTFEKGQQVDAIVGSKGLRRFRVVAFVFMCEGISQWQGRAFGCG